MALRADLTVDCWGRNDFSQCAVPATLSGVQSIAAGYQHSLAVDAAGNVVAWGRDDFGQCDAPATAVSCTQVSGGESHSLALRADGSVLAWGRNANGQGSVPPGVDECASRGWHRALLGTWNKRTDDDSLNARAVHRGCGGAPAFGGAH